MGRRKLIGINYQGGKNWIGGVYYIQNVINALNTLPDEDKPLIDIFTDGEERLNELRSVTKYPYLRFYKESIFKVGCRWLSIRLNRIFHLNLTVPSYHRRCLFIFPSMNNGAKMSLAWIPDFQEKYLPQLFSKEELDRRDRKDRFIAENINNLVLSSHDCENDFKNFYPDYQCKIHVLHFAVTLPDFSNADIDSLKQKYGIEGDYLFCPNQFWMHKNHKLLFKAYAKALSQGLRLQLVCTGELSDYRNPEYINELKSFITDNNLQEKIRILGFISIEDMLCLMKNSYAIIQPSLFEGWSTTVEDVKALNKFIFLSDLKVHREQMKHNVCFFDPRDEDDLCSKLLSVDPYVEQYDYQDDVIKFGKTFLNIIQNYK